MAAYPIKTELELLLHVVATRHPEPVPLEELRNDLDNLIKPALVARRARQLASQISAPVQFDHRTRMLRLTPTMDAQKILSGQ
jgi:hypothetical protein